MANSYRNTGRHTGPTNSSQANARLVILLREAWWIALIAGAIFLALILLTYHKSDPGWSYGGSDLTVHNAGGRFGAWFADVLLHVFGLSAYWGVVFVSYLVWWGYRRMERTGITERRSVFVAFVGFVLVLFSSSALEHLRLYNLGAQLPDTPGGISGAVVGEMLSSAFGFTGSSLFLLALFGIGFSLLTNASWLAVMEKIGAGVEWMFITLRSRIENRRDRKAGEAAKIERQESVQVLKKHFVDDHEPIRIERPVLEIPKSARVQKEKQVPLFADLPDSPLPPVHLLDEADGGIELLSAEMLEFTSRLIERKLLEFGVEVKVVAAYPGPVITRYEIEPAVGVKGNQILNLTKDLARALSVVSIRVVETIPGKNYMGLELPNPKRQIIRLSEIVSSQVYADMASPLTIAMGKDITGKAVVADLAKMPHVLVAGTTGSGKSVAINAMILSLVYKADPSQVRLILVDPKMLELSVYEGIPHLLAPVVTDMRQAAHALTWCVNEMDKRYRLMSSQGVRNLAGFNQKIADAKKTGTPIANPFTLTPESPEPLDELPMIVVVIDELADMMMVVGKKVEELIARLAQKARASGIHLVLATQRPSVDVITGLIKANIPTRVAFQVSSKIDSRTILDQQGAEALLGQGDMLYLPPGTGYPQRVHGAYVSDNEVHAVVNWLKKLGEPQYIEGILDGDEGADSVEGGEAGAADVESDPLYDQAVELVLKSRRASISSVQRQLRIGYNRAARLIEQMERAGLVSSMQTNGNREVLSPNQE